MCKAMVQGLMCKAKPLVAGDEWPIFLEFGFPTFSFHWELSFVTRWSVTQPRLMSCPQKVCGLSAHDAISSMSWISPVLSACFSLFIAPFSSLWTRVPLKALVPLHSFLADWDSSSLQVISLFLLQTLIEPFASLPHFGFVSSLREHRSMMSTREEFFPWATASSPAPFQSRWAGASPSGPSVSPHPQLDSSYRCWGW